INIFVLLKSIREKSLFSASLLTHDSNVPENKVSDNVQVSNSVISIIKFEENGNKSHVIERQINEAIKLYLIPNLSEIAPDGISNTNFIISKTVPITPNKKRLYPELYKYIIQIGA
ncbi:TPA: hypothetical protein I1703_002277, partial [Staphylococcus pseudintermedius]|nr:hypothetical protein [Staphylococcus pseudintermedius]